MSHLLIVLYLYSLEVMYFVSLLILGVVVEDSEGEQFTGSRFCRLSSKVI